MKVVFVCIPLTKENALWAPADQLTLLYLVSERERELCVRERLAEDKLARFGFKKLLKVLLVLISTALTNDSIVNRAENLVKNYNLFKEQRLLMPTTSPGRRRIGRLLLDY